MIKEIWGGGKEKFKNQNAKIKDVESAEGRLRGQTLRRAALAQGGHFRKRTPILPAGLSPAK